VRKHFVIDPARRRARALDGEAGPAEGAAQAAAGARRRALVLLAALVAVSAGAFAVWRFWLAPPVAPVAAPAAVVPEHQRSGPLANPWGNEAPVTASRAEETAAAASAATPAATAAIAASGPGAGPVGRGVPPSRDAVREALARLRSAGKPAEFLTAALQGGDAAALVAAWMAERQCRQTAQWRQVMEWRRRGSQERAPPGPAPSAASLARCVSMPEPELLEAALAAAGFPTVVDIATEPTRRPIDFALAVAVGDPLLLAEVLEASDVDRVGQQLRAWGADARDLLSPEVQRAAVWLASCTPPAPPAAPDAPGRAGNAAAQQAACREHPALWQACLNDGLCDVRDLRDLMLRTMSATEAGAVERLARALAPRMGR
jgi:hypothetical protein